MGHRLSKIVTRTGDAGTTGLGDGSRVAKDSPRIEAIGTVDELNSATGHQAITPAHIDRLERAVEDHNADLAPLKEFILPGGTRAAALVHVARTVCRRTERAVVALAAHDDVSTSSRVYLNRLSDLLFVLARALNRAGHAPAVLWQKDRARGERGR